VRLSADPVLLSRVIRNLLGNAFKFTPEGGSVRVGISKTDREARVTVTDEGPGIPAEYHEKIFEKFGQVEDIRAKTGTGLGLTFCKLAVELHSGRIGVESEVGGGSTFWFTLPLTEA
jgi:signal transduction histidine kinase